MLVVEYGPFDKGEDSVLVPGDYFPVPYLWLPFESTPQRALNNAVYTVPCGRVVGGGSAVNAMFFHRASAVDYHAWDELGATGWSWDDLFPYFKKVMSLLVSPFVKFVMTNTRLERDIYTSGLSIC